MILPMITGNIAPPIIDITMSDEAGLVFSFKSLIPKEKIVGNMIDIKKPKPPNATTTFLPSA